jgi:hypothetical protein
MGVRISVRKITAEVALLLLAGAVITLAITGTHSSPKTENIRVPATTPLLETESGPVSGPDSVAEVTAPLTATPVVPSSTDAPTIPPMGPATATTSVPSIIPTGSAKSRPASSGDAVTIASRTGTRYTDPQGRFSFTIPSDWRPSQAQDAQVAIQFVSDVPRGNLNVAAQGIGNMVTLDDFAAAAVADIQRAYPMYRFASQRIEATTLAGEPARRYDFQGVQNDTSIQFTQLIAVKDGTAYVVTLSAAASDSRVFAGQAQIVLDSFAFHG